LANTSGGSWHHGLYLLCTLALSSFSFLSIALLIGSIHLAIAIEEEKKREAKERIAQERAFSMWYQTLTKDQRQKYDEENARVHDIETQRKTLLMRGFIAGQIVNQQRHRQ